MQGLLFSVVESTDKKPNLLFKETELLASVYSTLLSSEAKVKNI